MAGIKTVRELREAHCARTKTIDKHCEETGEFYTDVENEISDRIFKRISAMENVTNISGTLNDNFYSFYVNSETGKNLTLEDFDDAFGLK